jgi:hypothetical protein
MQPQDYGKCYYCSKVTEDVAADGEIYAFADRIETPPSGALALVSLHPDTLSPVEIAELPPPGKQVYMESRFSQATRTLLIPADKWLAVYAASVMDGSAVAVQRWTGELGP